MKGDSKVTVEMTVGPEPTAAAAAAANSCHKCTDPNSCQPIRTHSPARRRV